MKLHPVKFGLAFGILYSVLFLLMGLAAAWFGWGKEMMALMGKFYVGFGPSTAGAVIGAVWGFGVGYVFFALGAWIYNALLARS